RSPSLDPVFPSDLVLDFTAISLRSRCDHDAIEAREPSLDGAGGAMESGEAPLRRQRELAAAIAIPIVFAILFFAPPLAFDALVVVVALAALWEFYRLAEKTGHPVAKTVGMLGAVFTFTAPFQFVFLDDWMRSTVWLEIALLAVLGTACAATLAELVSRAGPVGSRRRRGDGLRRPSLRLPRDQHLVSARRLAAGRRGASRHRLGL